jgi:hypothetical protein
MTRFELGRNRRGSFAGASNKQVNKGQKRTKGREQMADFCLVRSGLVTMTVCGNTHSGPNMNIKMTLKCQDFQQLCRSQPVRRRLFGLPLVAEKPSIFKSTTATLPTIPICPIHLSQELTPTSSQTLRPKTSSRPNLLPVA